jgi:hypothetical protein
VAWSLKRPRRFFLQTTFVLQYDRLPWGASGRALTRNASSSTASIASSIGTCDNTLYFITSRTRDRSPAFASDEAKAIFWDRFDHYAKEFDVRPIVGTLLDNHYHKISYVERGENLGLFMQRFHGSVAKLVNDTLDVRLVPFWRRKGIRITSTGVCVTRGSCVERMGTRCIKRCARASCATGATIRILGCGLSWRVQSCVRES